MERSRLRRVRYDPAAASAMDLRRTEPVYVRAGLRDVQWIYELS